MRWEVQVATGDQSMVSVLDVMWTVYCALSKWQTYLSTLSWNSKTFVHRSMPRETEERMGRKELNQGLKGWTSVWVGDTDMHFTTTDLQA